MLGSFLVLLREGFEATLLVAIVLAYLVKIERRQDFRQVWIGVGSAVLVSVGVGAALFATTGGLGDTAGLLFKAGIMWIAVGFLTYMILWMRRQARNVAQGIRKNVDEAVSQGSGLALATLAFVMVFREGLETALFMFGITQTATPLGVALGATVGIAGAVALGYAVYVGGKRINLGAFFKITGTLLVVVAAGLLARGVAMVEVAGVLPAILYPLWNVTHVTALTSESMLGQFLTAFFGWDARPDLLEFAVWATYILGVGYAFLRPATSTPAVQPAKASAEPGL